MNLHLISRSGSTFGMDASDPAAFKHMKKRRFSAKILRSKAVWWWQHVPAVHSGDVAACMGECAYLLTYERDPMIKIRWDNETTYYHIFSEEEMHGKEIDRLQDINVLEVSFKSLDCHYITGRPNGSRYRTGNVCELGNIEESVWYELADGLIESSGEKALFNALIAWSKEYCFFLHSESDRRKYCLDLHISRIFDDENWVDYKVFNERYRPEKTDNSSGRLVIRDGFMFYFEEGM